MTDYADLRRRRLAALDPERRTMHEVSRPPLRAIGVEALRARGEALMGAPTPLEDVSYHDVDVPGPYGPVPTRIFTPKQAQAPLGVYIHVHAGGFVMFGGLDTMTNVNQALARDLGCIVVSPDFKLPPEHRFPVGLEECWDVVRWVGENAARFGGDAARVAIGGGCTGANFAAVLAHMARDAGAPQIAAQYLAGPQLDCRANSLSQIENGEGYNLSHDDDVFVIEQYLSKFEDRYDWRATPILARTFRGLPPAYIHVGEWDVLRDESRAYADRLSDAGVPVTFTCMPQEAHAPTPAAAPSVRAAMIEFLRAHIGPAAAEPRAA